MSSKRITIEPETELRYGDTVEQLPLWYDAGQFEGSSTVMSFSRKSKRGGGTAGITLGTASHRWILFAGDLILITLSNFLSAWIRFGLPVNSVAMYTIAWVVTLILFPPAFYIFDLYNPERSFRSWETAYRSALAIGLVAVLSVCVFFLLPNGTYGRGVMVLQVVVAWVFVNGWRSLYSAYFQKATSKIPVIVIGAGESGRNLYDLLKSPLSPYEVKGFVDDDPGKTGRSI